MNQVNTRPVRSIPRDSELGASVAPEATGGQILEPEPGPETAAVTQATRSNTDVTATGAPRAARKRSGDPPAEAKPPAATRPNPPDVTSDSGIRLPGKLVHWPIDRLKPYERNPRTHSPEQ